MHIHFFETCMTILRSLSSQSHRPASCISHKTNLQSLCSNSVTFTDLILKLPIVGTHLVLQSKHSRCQLGWDPRHPQRLPPAAVLHLPGSKTGHQYEDHGRQIAGNICNHTRHKGSAAAFHVKRTVTASGKTSFMVPDNPLFLVFKDEVSWDITEEVTEVQETLLAGLLQRNYKIRYYSVSLAERKWPAVKKVLASTQKGMHAAWWEQAPTKSEESNEWSHFFRFYSRSRAIAPCIKSFICRRNTLPRLPYTGFISRRPRWLG